MNKIEKTLRDRFEEKYDINGNNGCWEWTASTSGGGYGKIGIKYKTVDAHRVSYELNVGEIPEGKMICHTCDNKICVNPDHLFLGDYKTNYQDMVEKGIEPKGEDFSKKLKNVDVMLIKLLLDVGERSHKEISELFDVSREMITNINNNKSWKHV